MRTRFWIACLSIALGFFSMGATSVAQVSIGVSVGFGPPELPVYEQPLCPGDGYIWTPGYWAWDGDDYYWVPGTWVQPPEAGYLWTPGYWGWGGGGFVFHEGYWGPLVGFYGGIDYGYGYSGRGYEGGRWDRGRFFYNRSVNNINVTRIHNVYNTTVVNRTVNRISYNGGNGGINERASAQDEAAARMRHVAAVAAQNRQIQAARSNAELRASRNHGRPPIAATPKPGSFKGRGVVAASGGGNYNPPPRAAGAGRPASPVHPRELSPATRPTPPNTGNPKFDTRYRQQQDRLSAKQDQDRQRLQQKQERDHQRMTQKNLDEARKQQTEQRHQQQTQKLVEKQTHEQRRLEQRQPPPRQQPQRQNQPKKP